jgi:hypothetical protein
MKFIKLNYGYSTKVDDADYEWLNQFIWGIAKRKGVIYAQTSKKINGVWQPVLMHSLIMNLQKGKRVDHADNDGLNNQRFNLRECNAMQNAFNSKGRSKKRMSNYKGIRKVRRKYSDITKPDYVRFYGRINVGGKEIITKFFRTEEDAVLACNELMKTHHGEFAKLNEI